MHQILLYHPTKLVSDPSWSTARYVLYWLQTILFESIKRWINTLQDYLRKSGNYSLMIYTYYLNYNIDYCNTTFISSKGFFFSYFLWPCRDLCCRFHSKAKFPTWHWNRSRHLASDHVNSSACQVAAAIDPSLERFVWKMTWCHGWNSETETFANA